MEAAPAATSSTGWKSHLEYCSVGFRSTRNPRVDVARLGALCGPSNGSSRAWSTELRVDDLPSSDEPVRHHWRGAREAKGCGRFLVGFVPDDGAALIVEVGGREPSQVECRLSQSGWCPSDHWVCDPTQLGLRAAAPPREAESGEALPALSLSKVNVEWWALPSAAAPHASRNSAPPSRPLPSVE